MININGMMNRKDILPKIIVGLYTPKKLPKSLKDLDTQKKQGDAKYENAEVS